MLCRLEEEVAREELIHERAMAELTQPIEITPPHLLLKEGEEGPSYAAKVQQLQMMVKKSTTLSVHVESCRIL